MNRRHVSLALSVVAFSIAAAPAPLFRDIAADVGLTFHHVTGATGEHFMPEIMGAGAALLDYDNDGDLDVYLIQGTALDPGKPPLFPPPAGVEARQPAVPEHAVPHREAALRRCHRQGRRRSRSATAWARRPATTTTTGFIDLYVTNVGGNVLYHNNGDGTFTDVTAQGRGG